LSTSEVSSYKINDKMDKSKIEHIIELLSYAGCEIMKIYMSENYGTSLKDDNSPVTRADLIADAVIKEGLQKIIPGVPVFSEESKDISYKERSAWNPLWILDPLDGTREFVARNNEFCISLALVLNNEPVAGFIHSPVTGETWMAFKGEGAFKLKNGQRMTLPLVEPAGPLKVILSRSHHSISEEEWIEKLQSRMTVEKITCGSAIKFCRIAEGFSDIYPKFGKIHEWDIAAGHIILKEAGGEIIELSTHAPPIYNKSDYHQSPFIAAGIRGKKIIRDVISS